MMKTDTQDNLPQGRRAASGQPPPPNLNISPHCTASPLPTPLPPPNAPTKPKTSEELKNKNGGGGDHHHTAHSKVFFADCIANDTTTSRTNKSMRASVFLFLSRQLLFTVLEYLFLLLMRQTSTRCCPPLQPRAAAAAAAPRLTPTTTCLCVSLMPCYQ